MNGVGSAAGSAAKKVKNANGELAAFDELNVLNKQSDDSSGGGGGGADSITPDFDFSAENPFLDSIMDAIEQGDWYKVGQLIGEKLRDSLNAIPWPDIQDKAVQWATNIADCINGFIEVPGLWTAIGHTIAQGLNTALLFADTLMQRIHWDSLGAGIAEGLTTAVAELRWDTLGRVLTDGMRAAILTLYNFVLHYSGWTDLGNGIATCINSAITNIPWLEAGLGVGGFAIGLLNALIAAVQGTNWNDLGHNIVAMIAAIDWPGLFSALSTLALDVLQAINTILGQVDWDAVGSKIMECLQAVDWVGILAQVAELISNCWPLLMAALAVSLLPVIGTFILDTVLPAILSGLGSLIVTVISAIGAWPVLLLAVLASIAAVIINYLVTHWDEIKQNFSQTLDDLAQALNTAGENLQHIWDTLWLTIKLLGLQIWETITTGWNNFWKGIDLALRMAGAALQAAWSACWLIIKLAAMQIWEDITTAWSNFWKGLSLLLSMAGAALNAVWTAAWSALADTVSSIWDGITSVVRGAVNGIIRIINGMISAIVGGMNAVIGLLNGFSFDVPEFAQDALGTAKVGFNIDPITAPQIPYLAQGAVIPANHEFLAVLGDQTNGTNVEAPLETIQQALARGVGRVGRAGHHNPLCRQRRFGTACAPADALHRQRKSPPWCAACGGRKLMIVIDGEQFKIDVLSVKRSADFLDKYAERLANGHLRRELIGVYFNYKLQFGPGLDRKEYARLWDKLTEPVEFHEVTVPDEDGDYTFTAYFSNVGDELLRKKAEKNYWKNLTANFIAQKPART